MTTPGIRLIRASETVFRARKTLKTARNVTMDPRPPRVTPSRTFRLPICFIVASERMATSLPSMRMALKARRNDPMIATVNSVSCSPYDYCQLFF